MSGWYLYNKYRSLSIRLTLFLLVAMAFLMLLNMIFVSPNIESAKKVDSSNNVKEPTSNKKNLAN